ncbi:MAG: glucose 1-dehydrogenase [Anaerolineae bacterium]|nr:glucose 1-dehydrogenase [Anaerolineae bacterium]
MTSSDLYSLGGKVAIVTGASRGIGKALAHVYAKAGARVVLASRKLDGLQPVAEAITAAGGEAYPVAAHMGDPEAIVALVKAAVLHFGGIDIIVNNAATNPHFGPLLTAEDSMWDKIFDVNLRGYFRLIREAVPYLQARGGGKIINMASIAGLMPTPGMGVYGMSKAAVIMMTKSLAVELAHSNIQVNAIAPGFIQTKFSQAIWGNDQLNEMVSKATPAKRIGNVEELLGMALYLASAASNFTTGQTFVVDGGLSLGSLNIS